MTQAIDTWSFISGADTLVLSGSARPRASTDCVELKRAIYDLLSSGLSSVTIDVTSLRICNSTFAAVIIYAISHALQSIPKLRLTFVATEASDWQPRFLSTIQKLFSTIRILWE